MGSEPWDEHFIADSWNGVLSRYKQYRGLQQALHLNTSSPRRSLADEISETEYEEDIADAAAKDMEEGELGYDDDDLVPYTFHDRGSGELGSGLAAIQPEPSTDILATAKSGEDQEENVDGKEVQVRGPQTRRPGTLDRRRAMSRSHRDGIPKHECGPALPSVGADADGPVGPLAGVRDEETKRLLMSWYYAGYYTGLSEGKLQVAQENAIRGRQNDEEEDRQGMGKEEEEEEEEEEGKEDEEERLVAEAELASEGPSRKRRR